MLFSRGFSQLTKQASSAATFGTTRFISTANTAATTRRFLTPLSAINFSQIRFNSGLAPAEEITRDYLIKVHKEKREQAAKALTQGKSEVPTAIDLTPYSKVGNGEVAEKLQNGQALVTTRKSEIDLSKYSTVGYNVTHYEEGNMIRPTSVSPIVYPSRAEQAASGAIMGSGPNGNYTDDDRLAARAKVFTGASISEPELDYVDCPTFFYMVVTLWTGLFFMIKTARFVMDWCLGMPMYPGGMIHWM